jgi:hypothetical protein
VIVEEVISDFAKRLVEEDAVEKLVFAAVKAKPRLAKETHPVTLPGRFAARDEAATVTFMFTEKVLLFLALQFLLLCLAYHRVSDLRGLNAHCVGCACLDE